MWGVVLDIYLLHSLRGLRLFPFVVWLHNGLCRKEHNSVLG